MTLRELRELVAKLPASCDDEDVIVEVTDANGDMLQMDLESVYHEQRCADTPSAFLGVTCTSGLEAF